MKVESPLTGSENVALLRSFSTEKIVEDWEKTFGIDVTAEFGNYSDFHLYLCRLSGLRFFYPLDITGSSQLYEKLMEFEWYYMFEKWEYEKGLKDLAGKKNILEIGSGQGHFLLKAKNKGFRVKGIDSNRKAVLNAQKKGLSMRHGLIQELLPEEKSMYDCICSFQVLEHVPYPLQFLKGCIELLKPGGILLLCVPNEEGFLQHQYNLLDMPPHHMTQWSVNVFRFLETLLPLKLVETSFEPLASYHITSYLEAKKTYLKAVFPWASELVRSSIVDVYEAIVNTDFRRFIRGQNLYVKFRKQ